MNIQPLYVTKATAPEAVLTGTRGPDMYSFRDQLGEFVKLVSTGPIRAHITDWAYGAQLDLPFVLVPHAACKATAVGSHFWCHVRDAAKELNLPAIQVTQAEMEAIAATFWQAMRAEEPAPYVIMNNARHFRVRSPARLLIAAICRAADPERTYARPED